MSSHSDKLLPQCKGPKLHPFSDRDCDIEFIRLLSDNEQEGQSHVFEAAINGQHYALKVFKFFDDDDIIPCLFHEEIRDYTIETLRMQEDPFFNECRAYGRLIEAGVNGKIAARCYGYLSVPADREKELYDRFDVSWDRPSDQPAFRAIVKDIMKVDEPVTERMLGKMRRDLLRMRKLGVHPQDLYLRNYGGGLLLDFSIAVTAPHRELSRPAHHVACLKNEELCMFQNMIRDSEIRTWLRTKRNREYCKKLRNCPDGMKRRGRKRYPA